MLDILYNIAVVAIIVIVIFVVGTVIVVSVTSSSTQTNNSIYDTSVQEPICCKDQAQLILWRFYDDQAKVVCWVYAAGSAGGISCLPYSETKLDR